MGIRDAVAQATGEAVEFGALGPGEEYIEAEPDEAPDSILADLRRRVQATADEQTVDLELPWLRGLMWGRYKPIPIDRMLRTTRAGLEPGTDPAVAADALGLACVELLRTDPDRPGELLALNPHGTPTRYDDTLVELLGLRPTARTARAVVFALFAASGRADALSLQHCGQYTQWLTGTEVAADAAGEPLAG